MESTRALNREALYAASKDLEHAAKNRGKPAKKEKKAAAATEDENKAAAAAAGEASVPKADKKRKSESQPTSNGTKPDQSSSVEKGEPSKKAKKSKPAATAAKPRSAPADEPLPSTFSGGKKNKKKAKKSEEQAAGELLTPVVSPTAEAAMDPSDPRRRKSVRFSLKRNLVMTIGQPPLPEDIRTPPTSKPKGSALKVKYSAQEMRAQGYTRHGASALGKPAAVKRLSVDGPASAPPKYHVGANGSGRRGKGRSPVGTRSVAKGKGPGMGNGRRNSGGGQQAGSGGKRPRAADFF